jgi:hypothetical protein
MVHEDILLNLSSATAAHTSATHGPAKILCALLPKGASLLLLF